MARTGRPEVREKIFAESVKQFLQKGLRGTVVSDITDAINISKGSFYWYFNSKNDVLEEIVNRWDKTFLGGLTNVVEKTEGGFMEKFRASHKYATEFAYNNRNLCVGFLTLSAELVGSGTEIEKKIRGAYAKFVDVFRGLVELGKAEGRISADADSAVKAHVIVGIHNGMLFEWYLNAGAVNSKSLAIGYLDVTLQGVLKKEVRSIHKMTAGARTAVHRTKKTT